MNLSVGNGGWVRVDDERLPGPLYVRLNRDDIGRWRITQLYLDGQHPITGEQVRQLPIARIEAAVSGPDLSAELVAALDHQSRFASVPLDVLASHYNVTFGSQAKHWVADAWRSQFPNSGVRPVKVRKPKLPDRQEVPPLRPPEDGRLTDDFLREVHRAYVAAVDHGQWPAPTLARQAGVERATVRKWIYTARKRGIMPKGEQGRVG